MDGCRIEPKDQTMKTMNTDQFKAALERAGRIKGADGVTLQKKLILENYMITDTEGMAVDPDSLDVTISAGMEEDMMKEEDKETMAKTIRREIAARMDSMPRGLSAVANVDDKPWERAPVYSAGRKAFTSKEMAWKFGTWCLATLGHKKSLDHCKNFGIVVKAHTEGVNTQGGFLVPDEMAAELVTLREQYGVFRRNAKIYRMASDTLRIPRRNTGLTAYWVGEAIAATESTMGLDNVQLVAKKLTALATISNELLEDSVIDLASDVANEIAYQFAFKEDDAGFNGDGTSTYGGVVGLVTALSDSTYQVSDAGASAAYADVTVAHISAGIAKLPAWAAQRNNVKIYCPKAAYHGAFERLALSAGGATAAEVANGLREPRFFGYPVEFTQAIAASQTGGAVYAYVGDLSQACYLGDRRATSIAFSDSALNAFEQDERVVRGTERVDIVCANVGSSSASGAMIKLTL
jgi:HK97 family phage major capsid protein